VPDPTPPSAPAAAPPPRNPFAAANFLLSAARLEQLPADALPEAAFVGRSNAGKSSALNKLCGHKALARVSKTPGRTQLINLFGLPGARLVDLPGYGFAAVPGAVRQDWGRLIGGYLETRRTLRLLVVLMDSRHPLTPLDLQMLEWAEAAQRPCHILLTKADKLSRHQGLQTLRAVEQQLAGAAAVTVQLFSALDGQGVEAARVAVAEHLGITTQGEQP